MKYFLGAFMANNGFMSFRFLNIIHRFLIFVALLLVLTIFQVLLIQKFSSQVYANTIGKLSVTSLNFSSYGMTSYENIEQIKSFLDKYAKNVNLKIEYPTHYQVAVCNIIELPVQNCKAENLLYFQIRKNEYNCNLPLLYSPNKPKVYLKCKAEIGENRIKAIMGIVKQIVN